MIVYKNQRTGKHIPVLLFETLELLAIKADGVYLDATLGEGGHTRAILEKTGCEKTSPSNKPSVVALERDPLLARKTAKELAKWERCLRVLNVSFNELNEALAANGLDNLRFDGIVFDLGLSRWHLERSKRGFSFNRNEPLDMRFNTQEGISVKEFLAKVSEQELVRILKEYGEEKKAGRIARAIINRRKRAGLQTTAELISCVEEALGRKPGKPIRGGQLKTLRRVFQALRIAVNHELRLIEEALPQAIQRLIPGGRIVIISYHSLEDRIVKKTFRSLEGKVVREITKKQLVTPSAKEISNNPAARSAKLRCAERL